MRIWLIIPGLIIGSFLGALTYRLPRKLDTVKDRSRCPNCKKVISWFDNIPLISFLLLKGHCRFCKKPISIRYPVIELVTAILFVTVGFNPFALVIGSTLLAIFVVDLEAQIIPDVLVFSGLCVVLFDLILFSPDRLFVSLLGGLLSACALLFLHLITKGKGMGLGDVKLAVLIGSLTGLGLFLTWLFFSFISGALVGILLLVVKKASLKQRVAFGPFLIIGLILTIFFGSRFISLIGI